MVRWLSSRVVDLHGVLPGRAAGRLRVLRLGYAALEREGAGAIARRAAAREPRVFADRHQRALEADRLRRPDAVDPRLAARHHRSALLSALDDRAAGAVVGGAHALGCAGLSLLFAVEPGVAGFAAGVPGVDRAVQFAGTAGAWLVVGIRCLCRAVCGHDDLCVAALGERCAACGASRDSLCGTRCEAAHRRLPAVARAAGPRLVAVARDHQSHHAERGGDPVPVGAAAVGLLVDLRAVLRKRSLVSARHLFTRRGGDAAALRIRPARRRRLRRQDRLADLRRRALRAVHVPARRDGADAAGAELSHALLSDAIAGRRHRWRDGRSARTARAASVLRTRHRAGADRAARRGAGGPRVGSAPVAGRRWRRTRRLLCMVSIGADSRRHDRCARPAA